MEELAGQEELPSLSTVIKKRGEGTRIIWTLVSLSGWYSRLLQYAILCEATKKAKNQKTYITA